VPTIAKRFLIIAAGVLAAAAIVLLCINLYLQSGGVQQRIREAAVRSLGSEVNIQSTAYTPWSGLVIRGITVPDPTNAELNIVEAAALRIRFALRPLFGRRFVVTECTLFGPRLIVRQLENGDWLIPLPAPRPQMPEIAKEPALATARGVSFKAELERFRLRGGNVIFLNAKNRAIVTLDRVDISGQIAPDRSVAGIFEIGKADLFTSLKPRKVGGAFTWDGKMLDLPDIQGSLAGGKLTGKYRVESNEQPSFALGLQLDGVLLRKLAEEAQVEPGKTEGTLQGSMSLGGDPRNSNSIAGEGHFELISAKLRPVEFLVKLGELLQIDELQLLKLSDARVDLTVRDERVQVEDITLRSDNLILRGQGPVRFNGKMNLDARLLFNLKLQNQLKGVIAKNLVESEDPDYRQIPFTVTGRIDNPKTDLLDKLIGVKVGQDVGGILMNILRSGAPQKSESKSETDPPAN
jgi:type II secretion system protein N